MPVAREAGAIVTGNLGLGTLTPSATLDFERYCQLEVSPCEIERKKIRRSRYHSHRFLAEIISHAAWLCHHFSFSFRDVEDILADPGTIVSY